MNRNLLTLFFSMLMALTPAAHAAPLFTDSFESGNFTASNSDGFRWASPNSTSIANKTTSHIPHDGDYSLRFTYPANAAWSEQRFYIGQPKDDIWFSFWLKVPTNFAHGSANNKLFAVWMDEYSARGDGPTVVWESWGNGSGGSNLAVHWSEGNYVAAGEHIQLKPFINATTDRGKWMQIVLHVKAATRRATPINNSSYPYLRSDGVIEFWRRWEGQTTFEKLHDVQNANIAPPTNGPKGWLSGYLMGWANAAYSTNTDWLIDQFTISETSLLDIGTNINPPMAPSLSVEISQ